MSYSLFMLNFFASFHREIKAFFIIREGAIESLLGFPPRSTFVLKLPIG